MLFRLFLFVAPTLLSSKPAYLLPLLRSHGLQASLAPYFTAFAAHRGHDLGHEIAADGHRFAFADRLQDHAAGVLNNIQFFTSAFWHDIYQNRTERRGGQPVPKSNLTTTQKLFGVSSFVELNEKFEREFDYSIERQAEIAARDSITDNGDGTVTWRREPK